MVLLIELTRGESLSYPVRNRNERISLFRTKQKNGLNRFNEERRAVEWIFRYGNQVQAFLEKVPLEQLIGNTFSSRFPNLDDKRLRAYEQAALYGAALEVIDYSPEIDTYLRDICFPTFKGHCGCIADQL